MEQILIKLVLSLKNRTCFLLLLFAIYGCCSTPSKEYLKAIEIQDVGNNLDLILSDGQTLKLAYLQFPPHGSASYEKTKAFLRSYLGQHVKFSKASFSSAFMVYIISPIPPCALVNSFRVPFDYESMINYQLIVKGLADFISPVKDPEKIPEFQAFIRAQRLSDEQAQLEKVVQENNLIKIALEKAVNIGFGSENMKTYWEKRKDGFSIFVYPEKQSFPPGTLLGGKGVEVKFKKVKEEFEVSKVKSWK